MKRKPKTTKKQTKQLKAVAQPEQPAAKPKLPRSQALSKTWSAVEYDSDDMVPATRGKKIFAETEDARAFYNQQLAKKTKPIIRRASLGEAFPSEPVNPNYVPTTRAAGDPTKTETVNFELESEKDMKTEAKKKTAKQLRRKQRKGVELWRKADTKTVVGVKWDKGPSDVYDRWMLKFSDETEQSVQHLAIVYSRGHKDHHLRAAYTTYIDGLNNKQYELILVKALEQAQRQARHYGASLKNFKGSDAVQKDLNKRASKKGEAGEEPLTPRQVELATKLAELANYYCSSVSYFFMLPEKLKKHPHATLSPEQVMEVLEKAGINETDCTIRVVQMANRILGRMTPRLQPGGPQIGTPELAKQHEQEQSTKAVKAKAAAKEAIAKVAEEGGVIRTPNMATGERDAWGSLAGSKGSLINAAVFGDKAASPITPAWIAAKTAVGSSRIASHLRYLLDRKYILKVEGGYATPAGSAKPAKEAKAGKAKKQPSGKAGKGASKGAKPTKAGSKDKKPAKAPVKGSSGRKAGKKKAGKGGK